jgi:FkbH-like protein
MTDGWWRFVPAEGVLPSAGSITAAAAAGRGALTRELRQARAALGTARAASLLRSAEAAAPARFGEPVRLLLVTAQQPRPIEDALRVAFAIAGLAVDIRAIEGVLDLRTALADPATKLFADLDLVLMCLPDEAGGRGDMVSDAATAVAARALAPVAIADFAPASPGSPAEGGGVIVLPLPADGTPVFDARFAATFGAILSPAAADRLADAAAGLAARLKGTAPKLLVTDLDGTLWRGVLGEASEGAAPPELDRAYAETLAALRQRGFVLALASRNDPADVERHFETLGDAPLSLGDFSARAVGWSDKPGLVAEVLDRLGLSSAHAVFVDDDPVNCAKVAARFPEMDVRRFTGDGFAATLLGDPLLAGGSVSNSAARAEQYQRKAAVDHLRAGASDAAAFLESLRTQVTIRPLEPDLLPRAAELASRVNQFRFTALRPNILELGARPGGLDFMAQLDDAFGAHGLVGLVLASIRGDDAVIDAFCLSCRALERGVESVMLHALACRARALGLSRVTGRIEILARNEPARDCLARHGFVEREGEWQLALTAGGLEKPDGLVLIDPLTGSDR